MKNLYISLFVICFTIPLAAFAHPGGLDANGGHTCYTNCATWNLKNGEYHLHDANNNPINTYTNNTKIYSKSLAEKLHGQILLQVESHGEAWYIRSKDSLRYYMKNGDAAYQMMRYFSLGITDADLAKIPSVATTDEMNVVTSVCTTNPLAKKLKGQILLRVERHGEAWYVDPDKCRSIYLKDGAAAYEIMRYLGLGIKTLDLEKIPVGTVEF